MRFFLTALLALTLPAAAEQRTNLKVVELFTSQGCSSCPPADHLLSTLVDHDHLLPLAFHVDYWNYLGWQDELSASFATARQVAYRDAMAASYVYTPQFVVGGANEFGLREREELLHDLSQPAMAGVDLTWTETGLSLEPVEGGLEQGFVWFVTFIHSQEAMITAGENRGRDLTYHHAVDHIEPIAEWNNEATTIALSEPQGYGLAILISDQYGHIHSAAAWTRDE